MIMRAGRITAMSGFRKAFEAAAARMSGSGRFAILQPLGGQLIIQSRIGAARITGKDLVAVIGA